MCLKTVNHFTNENEQNLLPTLIIKSHILDNQNSVKMRNAVVDRKTSKFVTEQIMTDIFVLCFHRQEWVQY